jgi:hypothetical protein
MPSAHDTRSDLQHRLFRYYYYSLGAKCIIFIVFSRVLLLPGSIENSAECKEVARCRGGISTQRYTDNCWNQSEIHWSYSCTCGRHEGSSMNDGIDLVILNP